MKQLRTLATGALIAGVLVLGATTYRGIQERAILDLRLHAADSTVASLQHRKAQIDTVFVVRKAAALRQNALYDTISHAARVEVPPMIDSVSTGLLDPAPVVARMMGVLDQADTTIAALTLTLAASEARVAIRDSIITVQAQEIDLLKHVVHRGFWGQVGHVAKEAVKYTGVFAGGYIAGQLLVKGAH